MKKKKIMPLSICAMPLWKSLEPGPKNKFPDIVYVIIEVPKDTNAKYELDPKTGALILSRDLFSSMTYPGDYGSIPQTLCEDGDPVDALVLTSQPHYPGVVIPARPIALLEMKDEKGKDNKVLCVPKKEIDPAFKDLKGLKDVPKNTISEIEHFFKHMKELEPGKWVKLGKWETANKAKQYILKKKEDYKKEYETTQYEKSSN